jgi:hypothetical protein
LIAKRSAVHGAGAFKIDEHGRPLGEQPPICGNKELQILLDAAAGPASSSDGAGSGQLFKLAAPLVLPRLTHHSVFRIIHRQI